MKTQTIATILCATGILTIYPALFYLKQGIIPPTPIAVLIAAGPMITLVGTMLMVTAS